MKYILIICSLFLFNTCYSQVKSKITIKNIDYVVTVDTITHKVTDVSIIDKETFFEKLYIGNTFYPTEGNLSFNLLWDCSEYGKIGLGYNLGHKIFGISAYISLGRLNKRKDKIDVIYF